MLQSIIETLGKDYESTFCAFRESPGFYSLASEEALHLIIGMVDGALISEEVPRKQLVRFAAIMNLHPCCKDTFIVAAAGGLVVDQISVVFTPLQSRTRTGIMLNAVDGAMTYLDRDARERIMRCIGFCDDADYLAGGTEATAVSIAYLYMLLGMDEKAELYSLHALVSNPSCYLAGMVRAMIARRSSRRLTVIDLR